MENPPANGKSEDASLDQTGPAPEREMEIIKDPWRVSRRLRVGLAVLLRRPMGGGDFWVSLAGWVRGQWLLFNGVERLVLSGALIKGAGLDFRFLSRGAAHGFSTSVLSIFKDPPLLLIKWPDQLQVMSVAGEARSEVEVEVSVLRQEGEAEGETFRCQMLDISSHGCQVEMPRFPLDDPRFAQGDLVRVLLPLPGEDDPTPIAAEVRNVQVFRDSLNLGLQFTAGQDHVSQRIAYVLEHQLD